MFKFLNSEWLLKLIYLYSKALGFNFITIRLNSSQSVMMSTTYWDYASMLINFGFSFYSMFFDGFLPVANIVHSNMMELGVNVNLKLMILTTSVLKISCLVQSRRFFNIIFNMHWINVKVRPAYCIIRELTANFFLQLLNHKVSSMTKLQVFVSSIVVTSLFILIALLSLYFSLTFNLLLVAEYLSRKDKIIFFYSVFLNLFFFSTFIIVLSSAYYQLHEMNGFLSKLTSDRQNLTTAQIMKKTAIMFDKFCDMFEDISRFYLLNILIFISSSLIFFIFFIYGVYLNSMQPNGFLPSIILWWFYFVPPVLWMAVFASWMEKEGKRTGNLIYLLVHSDRTVEVLTRSNILMQQFKHRQPKISCGLFDLNWKFFFFLSGLMSSFSIILIQFYDVSKD